MNALMLALIALVAGAFLLYFHAQLARWRWLRGPWPPGCRVRTHAGRRYLTVRGTEGPTIVVETGLGAPSAEWWPLQERLAAYGRVVTYDRAGYGWSDAPRAARSSAHIARELHALLSEAGIAGPYILVAHSQGGLYAQHFARLYPSKVAGCVLLDPASPDNARFAQVLDARVSRHSGVDKLPMLSMAGRLARLGLLPLLKPLLMKSPPFSYYRSFAPMVRRTLWRHYLRPALYETAAAEYRQGLAPANTREVLAQPFPAVPVTVLYHTPALMVDEIVSRGRVRPDEARRVEDLWRELTRGYLELSPYGRWIEAERSGHFIHLDRPDLVVGAIAEMLAAMEVGSPTSLVHPLLRDDAASIS